MSFTFDPFDTSLRDGRSVHLRAISPSDEEELLQTFERMSPEARYMRFMRTVSEPNRERLRKALATIPESGIGIVATVPAADGIDIVGTCIAMIGNDPSSCEFAITVAADYARTGLGRVLMAALIDAARRRGLQEMEGFVLAANQPMLRLAGGLGFAISNDPDDFGVRLCRLRLAAA